MPIRRSIVRLIASRELRDLLRDRRTLLIILTLPIILYPIFGLVAFLFAITALDQKVIIGVAGMENLPESKTHPEAFLGGAILFECQRRLDDPPLIVEGKFQPRYTQSETELGSIEIRKLDSADESLLQSGTVDVLFIVPSDFRDKLSRGEKPAVTIKGREGVETSKLAVKRLTVIVARWQREMTEVRFARLKLPYDFDEPFKVHNEQESKPVVAKAADELRDILVKFIPFLLVMWTMAGALHPAIDLTAGEKERGTMETLLISPAERGEIVAGKFVAVWVFSYGTALWNLLWMGGGAVALGLFLPFPVVSLAGLAWAVLFAAPLAALFSAVAIGLGVFARSTKEGQYYLMPLLLLTLPLSMWSMTPGLKLTLPLSLVPITGLSLLLHRLMSVAGEPVPTESVVGVVLSLLCCVLLSLWWASKQFLSEGVLFREAERFSLVAWVRTMLGKGR